MARYGKHSEQTYRQNFNRKKTVKHGLEIMGIGLLDVANNKCMMLRAHQTIGNSALKMWNKTLVEFVISMTYNYQLYVIVRECRML